MILLSHVSNCLQPFILRNILAHVHSRVYMRPWKVRDTKLETSAHDGRRKIDNFVWGARLIEYVLTLVIKRWDKRNNVKHRNNAKLFSLIWRQRREEEIKK